MSNLVLVGYITGSHGIKGEVKVKTLTSNFFNFPVLYDKNQTVIYLNARSSNKDVFICSIKGVNDKNTANSFKGTEIFALRSDFPEILEEGEFYITDLIGLDVINKATNETMGTVFAMHNYGAGDICEVLLSGGQKIMLPFNDDTFPEINLSQGKIYCNVPTEI